MSIYWSMNQSLVRTRNHIGVAVSVVSHITVAVFVVSHIAAAVAVVKIGVK
jgi:hypothetical protein